MALSFPNSPNIGDKYYDPGSQIRYIWTGVVWTGDAQLADGPFTLEESYEVAYSAQGMSHTFVHTLGKQPKLILVDMECTIADNNFSVGDIIQKGFDTTDGFDPRRGLSIFIEPGTINSEVQLKVDNNGLETPEPNGGVLQLSAGRWKFILKVYA